MAESNRAAIDVDLVAVGTDMLQPGERNRRKSLVHFIKIDIADFHAGALQGAVGCEQGLFQHDHRVACGDRQIDDPRARGQAVILERLLRADQNRAGTVANLAGVGSGDGAPFLQQLDRADAFHRRVKADAFVDLVLFFAFGGFDFDRDNFIVKRARFDCLDGLLVAFQRKFVQVLTGEAVLLHQHFRAHELAELDAGIGRFQPFRHVGAKTGILEQLEGRAHRHAAHAFDAMRQNHVLGAGHHALRRELDCLLRRAALPVNRNRGNAVGQIGREHRVATDIAALFAALRNTAGDHILDGTGIKVIAIGNRIQRSGAEINRMYARQTAATTASRGANRINNIGICHSHIPYDWLRVENLTDRLNRTGASVKRKSRPSQ